jgi:hypothetical protein
MIIHSEPISQAYLKQPLLPKSGAIIELSAIEPSSKELSTTDKVRLLGSALEPMFSLGDTIGLASSSTQLATPPETMPLYTDLGSYSALSLGGALSITGIAFHSLNLQRAKKVKDAEGVKVSSFQLARFTAKKIAVITQIASMILSKSREAVASGLQKASSLLGAASLGFATVAFCLRLYDMHKLKRHEGNIENIYSAFFDDKEDVFTREGKIDRLGRALGDRSLADRISKKDPNITAEEISKTLKSTYKTFAFTTLVFILSITVSIVSIVIPLIQPVKLGLSIATNGLWLGVDGKFYFDELKGQKQISTALKVAYIAQIALSITSIVASSVFTFGAVPIAIAAIAVCSTAVPHLLRYFHQKKQERASKTNLSTDAKQEPNIENFKSSPVTSQSTSERKQEPNIENFKSSPVTSQSTSKDPKAVERGSISDLILNLKNTKKKNRFPPIAKTIIKRDTSHPRVRGKILAK